MADYQITGTLSLEDQMSNVLKNAMNSVEQFGSKTQSAVQKASSSVESVSRSMQLGGAAVTAMGVKSMKSFGDFEASLNKAAVVAGGTSKNIGELADVANKMGADLPLSAQDAADAMVSMAQDGASIDTIKQEFPAIAKAATAAGSDLQTTASVVQQSMNIWGKSLGSPAQAAATLTATANMSNASVEDMQQVLADAGGTAKQMGLSMQDLSTAVGLTTNKGIPAAQAAQNLNFALTRMIKPSKQAQDVMSQLGLSYFDANGNMKPFAQILQELNQKTSGLTNEQKALNLTTLFGQAGYKVMSSLMDSVADTTGNATTSWSAYKSELDKVTSSQDAANASLDSQAADMQNNIGSALEQVGGNWESLRNKSQEVSKDFNISMLHMVAGVLQAATKSNTAFGQMTQHLLGYSTYIGVAMTATGTFMTTVNNMVNGVSNLGKVFTALLSPQMLIVAGITALIAILAIAYNKSEAFRGAVSNISTAFTNVFGPALSGAQGAIGGIVKDIVDLATKIGNNLSNALNSIDWTAAFGRAELIILNVIQTVKNLIAALVNTGAVSAVWELIKSIFSLIGTILGSIIDLVSNFVGQTANAGQNAPQFEGLGNAIKFVADGLTDGVNHITDFVKQSNGSIGPIIAFAAGFTAIYLAISKVTGLFGPFGGGATSVGKAASQQASPITTFANAVLKIGIAIGIASAGIGIAAAGINLLAQSGDQGTAALVAMTAAITILVAVFAHFGPALTANAGGLATFGLAVSAIILSFTAFNLSIAAVMNAINGLSGNVQSIVPVFAAMGTGAVIAMDTILLGIVQASPLITQAITVLGQSMLQTIIALAPQVEQAFVTVLNGFLEAITEITPVLGQAAIVLITTFADVLIQSLPQVAVAGVAIIKAIADVITQSLPTIVKLGFNIILALLEGLDDNIVKITNKAVDIVVKFVDTMTQNIGKIVTAGVNFVIALVKGIAYNYKKLISAGIYVVVKLIGGIANSIPKIVDSGIKLVAAIVEGIGYAIGSMPRAGLKIIGAFIKGVINGLTGSKTAGKSVMQAVKQGLESLNLIQNGKSVIAGFLRGLQEKFRDVQRFVGGIADWIKQHKGPISYDKKLLIPAGQAIMNGLNGGLDAGFDKVQSTVTRMNGIISDSFQPDIKPTAISDAVNSANRQLSTGLNTTVNGEMTLTKQPAYIDLNMNGSTYQGFVDDITNAQNTKIDLQNKYRL